MDLFIETKTIGTYGKMLAAEEKSAGTIEKYLRDVSCSSSRPGRCRRTFFSGRTSLLTSMAMRIAPLIKNF